MVPEGKARVLCAKVRRIAVGLLQARANTDRGLQKQVMIIMELHKKVQILSGNSTEGDRS